MDLLILKNAQDELEKEKIKKEEFKKMTLMQKEIRDKMISDSKKFKFDEYKKQRQQEL